MSLYNASEEAGTPATPSAARQIIYPKSGGWYSKNAAGTEYLFLVSGGALGIPASGDLSSCTSNTETAANNSTQLATTAYADRLIGGTLAGAFTTLSASGTATFGTGAVGIQAKIVIDGGADAGWGSLISMKAGNVQYGLIVNSGALLGTTATDMVVYAAAGKTINLWPNGGLTGAVVSSTGLAVTGTISATTTIKTGGYTVATLPAGVTGDRAYVTDATAPTYLGALTGGGTVVCPVFKNATGWVSA